MPDSSLPLHFPDRRLGENCLDWESLVTEAIRQTLPQARLLRWAVTSVDEGERVAVVEAVATLPAA